MEPSDDIWEVLEKWAPRERWRVDAGRIVCGRWVIEPWNWRLGPKYHVIRYPRNAKRDWIVGGAQFYVRVAANGHALRAAMRALDAAAKAYDAAMEAE